MHFYNFKFFCFLDKFDFSLINSLPKNTTIIYRNYSITNNINEIIKIKKHCHKKKIKIFLSNNVKLAIRLGMDGAYIPSFNKSLNHRSFKLKKKFELIGSAHNIKQIRFKELQLVKNIFLSPIFLTKKNKNFLGIYRFINLKRLSKTKFTCLGGINKKNIKLIKMINLENIAGITLFKNLYTDLNE